jgi:hypothetical protein
MMKTRKARWQWAMIATFLVACGKDAAAPEQPRNEPVAVDGGQPSDDASTGSDRDDSVSDIEKQLAGEGEAGTDLKTEEWLALLRVELPKEFCKEGTYFRSCFAIDKVECMRVAEAQYDPCVRKHRSELPKIRTVEDGGKGGEILGRCAGAGFFEAVQGKFKNTPKCNDANAW